MEILNLNQIPLWLKLAHTLFVCFLISIYWKQYGPSNFLWFSDIALMSIVAALWLESSLITSMMALSAVLLDVVWNLDFFVRVISGKSLTGLSDYMFNRKISRKIRAISLFHIVFPVLLLWMLSRLGYDRRAFVAQTLLPGSFCRHRIFLLPARKISTGFMVSEANHNNGCRPRSTCCCS